MERGWTASGAATVVLAVAVACGMVGPSHAAPSDGPTPATPQAAPGAAGAAAGQPVPVLGHGPSGIRDIVAAAGTPESTPTPAHRLGITVLGTRTGAVPAAVRRDAVPLQGVLFDHPVAGDTSLSSPYGWRINPTEVGPAIQFHAGQDYPVACGTPVLAAADGIVRFADERGTSGLRVDLDHGDGVASAYHHNSQLLVTPGQAVRRGEVIARSGTTGNSTGCHVHFAVTLDGRSVDPSRFLPTAPGQPSRISADELQRLRQETRTAPRPEDPRLVAGQRHEPTRGEGPSPRRDVERRTASSAATPSRATPTPTPSRGDPADAAGQPASTPTDRPSTPPTAQPTAPEDPVESPAPRPTPTTPTTPTPTPTPEPTPDPTPEPTPTEPAEPTPEPTPGPTDPGTPEPTPTPEPTDPTDPGTEDPRPTPDPGTPGDPEPSPDPTPTDPPTDPLPTDPADPTDPPEPTDPTDPAPPPPPSLTEEEAARWCLLPDPEDLDADGAVVTEGIVWSEIAAALDPEGDPALLTPERITAVDPADAWLETLPLCTDLAEEAVGQGSAEG